VKITVEKSNIEETHYITNVVLSYVEFYVHTHVRSDMKYSYDLMGRYDDVLHPNRRFIRVRRSCI
jgi:hypothetical protein